MVKSTVGGFRESWPVKVKAGLYRCRMRQSPLYTYIHTQPNPTWNRTCSFHIVGMYQYVPACTSMYQYVLVCTSMYQYVPVCTSMYWYITGMYQYVLVCTSMYQYVLVCTSMYQYRMHQYVPVCTSMYQYVLQYIFTCTLNFCESLSNAVPIYVCTYVQCHLYNPTFSLIWPSHGVQSPY